MPEKRAAANETAPGGAASLLRVGAGLWLVGYALAMVTPAAAALLVSAIWLATGRFARSSAIAALTTLVVTWAGRGAVVDDGAIVIAALLGFTIGAPAAPWGSLDAYGRLSPGGGWSRPRWQAPAARALLIAIAVYGAANALGEAAAASSTSGWALVLHAASLLCAQLWLPRRSRGVALGLGVGLSIALGVATSTVALPVALALLLLAAIDTADLPPPRPLRPELVLYDGHCGLCHGAVRWILAEDSAHSFVFAALGSETFQARISPQDAANLPDSVVVLTEDGRLLTRFAAIVHILTRLGGIWQVLEWALTPMPNIVGDAAYRAIAATRHRIFAPPLDACPLMPPELRARMLA